MTDEINRRDFIKRAAAVTAATSISMAGLSTDKVLGANDRIRLGVIGMGRQGTDNMQNFMQHGVEVAGVCDVFEPNLQKGLQAAGGKATTYKDFRKMLDDKTIDVVINATPDHWHALPDGGSLQGRQGRLHREAHFGRHRRRQEDGGGGAQIQARGAGRHCGSAPMLHFQKAVKLVQDGLLGKVSYVRTWNYSNNYPEGIGNPPDSDPPAGLDWDMWLGPAPKVPYNWNRFGVGDRWSTFRYFWDYANGWLADWGVHLMDIVQWAMKVDGPNSDHRARAQSSSSKTTAIPPTPCR